MTQSDPTSEPAQPGWGPGYPAEQPTNPAYPNQPYPNPPYPGQPAAGQPYPDQPPPYPGQPSAPPPYPNQPYPGQHSPTYPNQPYPGQPYPGQPASPNAPTQAFPAYPGQPAPPYPVSGTPVTSTPYSPYGYQPQYPMPVPPPKRKVWPALLIGGAVLLALIVIAGVGAVVTIAANRRNTPTAQTPTHSAGVPTPSPKPSPTPTFVPFSGDLRTLLLPRPPGATKDSNDGNGNPDGTVTIEQAAQTYADAAFGLTHMKGFGYQQGATESWHEDGNYSVQIVLFQFQLPSNTSEFVQKLEDGGDTDDFWDGRGDVPNIPNGRYYISAKTNNNGNYNFEIWFSHNGIAVRMNAFGPNRTDVEKLKTMAVKQYALLP